MAGLIPKSFIHDLLERADIVEIVDSRVPLKKPAKIIRPVALFITRRPPHLRLVRTSSFTIVLVVASMATPLTFSWSLTA